MKQVGLSGALETASIVLAMYSDHPAAIVTSMLSHLSAILLLSSSLIPILPSSYRNNKLLTLFVLSILGFIMWIVGFVFLLVLSIYMLRRQKVHRDAIYRSFSLEDFLMERVVPRKREFGETPLYYLKEEGIVDGEVADKVSRIISQIYSPQALRALKNALRSQQDKLRLYSFSTIYSLEKSLHERLTVLNRLLQDERSLKDEDKFEIYAELAQIYFDFVYFEIADKEIQEGMLKKAEHLALSALSLRQHDSLKTLLGRIYLRMGNMEKAEEMFIRVLDSKEITPSSYAIYLAEVYFLLKNYKKVKDVLNRYSESLAYTFNPYMYYILEYWGIKRR